MKHLLAILLLVTTVGCTFRSSDQSESSPTAPIEVKVGNAASTRKSPEDPDPKWRELIFDDAESLENIPSIKLVSLDDESVKVAVTNEGETTLQYYSAGIDHVQTFQETFKDGKWTLGNWDWCGTGKEIFEISPGESTELIFQFWGEHRERMLANFSEKGTDRTGLVVLATEPAE